MSYPGTGSTGDGYKLAKAGLEFIIEVALKEEFGRDYEVEYDYSILSEVYMTIKGPKKFTLNDAKRLKSKMNEIVANDEIIQRLNVDKKEAIAYYMDPRNYLNEKYIFALKIFYNLIHGVNCTFITSIIH